MILETLSQTAGRNGNSYPFAKPEIYCSPIPAVSIARANSAAKSLSVCCSAMRPYFASSDTALFMDGGVFRERCRMLRAANSKTFRPVSVSAMRGTFNAINCLRNLLFGPSDPTPSIAMRRAIAQKERDQGLMSAGSTSSGIDIPLRSAASMKCMASSGLVIMLIMRSSEKERAIYIARQNLRRANRSEPVLAKPQTPHGHGHRNHDNRGQQSRFALLALALVHQKPRGRTRRRTVWRFRRHHAAVCPCHNRRQPTTTTVNHRPPVYNPM